MSISEAIDFMDQLELTPTQAKIAELVVKEIKNRLSFLNHVGLSYLTLDRLASTLSGGEAQRIRLATQIGSRLTVLCMFWMNQVLVYTKETMTV